MSGQQVNRMNEQVNLTVQRLIKSGDVAAADLIDALHQQAEALRADKNVQLVGVCLERDRLRDQIEAARGLLRDMRHAATINPSCQFGMVNPCRCMFCVETRVNAFLTATPAPEVQAEQGERQEAVARVGMVPGTDFKSLDFFKTYLQELPVGTMLYTTPQPGPDVLALVEAGNPLSNAAYNLAQKQGHALTEYECDLLSELRKRWDKAVLASSQAQRK